MLTYKLRGFGISTKFTGAEIIRDGSMPNVEAIILEPSNRADRIVSPQGWTNADETHWRQAVMRRARWVARVDPGITYLIQYDSGRDNAETLVVCSAHDQAAQSDAETTWRELQRQSYARL